MRDSKQIFIKQLQELWQEYLEAGVDNKNNTKDDINSFMKYLNSRY